MRLLAAAILAVGFTACVTSNYVGDTYDPTQHVDIFFDAKDVEREYTTIGMLEGHASEYNTFEQMEKKLVQDAMAKGADAIILGGMHEDVIGQTSSTSNTDSNPRYWVDSDGDLHKEGGDHYSSYTTTQAIKEKTLSATLVKYKN